MSNLSLQAQKRPQIVTYLAMIACIKLTYIQLIAQLNTQNRTLN